MKTSLFLRTVGNTASTEMIVADASSAAETLHPTKVVKILREKIIARCRFGNDSLLSQTKRDHVASENASEFFSTLLPGRMSGAEVS